jgi:hypothetical protein
LFEGVGEVVNATIISRQNRSLGYGFVELKNEARFHFNHNIIVLFFVVAVEAQKRLDKTDLNGREIRIEISRSTGFCFCYIYCYLYYIFLFHDKYSPTEGRGDDGDRRPERSFIFM